MIKIASPLADENTTRRIQKLVKERRGTSEICRGIKHCQKKILSETKGILVLAADTTPMDLITHIPAICEEKNIPYIFVKSQLELKVVNPKSEHVTCCFIETRDGENHDRIKKILPRCCYKPSSPRDVET